MEKIDVRMVVVVVEMDIHKMLSIEDSWVAKQGIICDARIIPCYDHIFLVKGSYRLVKNQLR